MKVWTVSCHTMAKTEFKINLKSHMWLIAIIKHSTALGDISLFKVRGRAIMYHIFDSLAVVAINHWDFLNKNYKI